MRWLAISYMFLKRKIYGAFCEHHFKLVKYKTPYKIYECDKCGRLEAVYV